MRARVRESAAIGALCIAALVGCGGGVAVVGGDAAPASPARDVVDVTAPEDVPAAPDAEPPRDVVPEMDRFEPAEAATPDDIGVAVEDSRPGRVDAVAVEGAVPDVPSPEAGACLTRCVGVEQCCSGACFDTRSSPLHCGGCNRPCRPGQSCFGGACLTPCGAGRAVCAGACVDLATDVAHCGACGNACPAGGACVGGACACPSGQLACAGQCAPAVCMRGAGACANAGPQRCVDGALVCGAVADAPGAEVCNNRDDDCDGRVDEELSQPCFVGPGAPGVGICRAGAEVCANGAWGACVGAVTATAETCDGRDENCNGVPDDGVPDVPCFTVPTSNRNVGRCRDGARRCVGGAPSACLGEITPLPEICNGMDDDCDGMTDEMVDPTLCPGRQNSVATGCAGTACQYACAPGYGDCDGNPLNGCEVDTRTRGDHCGACDVRCTIGQFCDSGACRASCSATVCGGVCVDTRSDPRNCGACGRQCAAPSGGSAACIGGTCVASCPTGTSECDGQCVNLAGNPLHCGSCGNACRAGQVCALQSGVPVCACPTGSTDCGGTCVNTQSDALHCGSCGGVCPAGSSCVNGSCRCSPSGLAPCGGTCAGLGQPCASGLGGCRVAGTFACIGGAVTCNAIAGAPTTEVCNDRDDDCDGIVDNSNAEDSCPMVFSATSTCVAGVCRATCYPGRGDCDGVTSTGCETDLFSSSQHCGRCGAPCAGLCLAGACVPCGAGQTVCGGACVDLGSDDANCGICGLRCGADFVCELGACRRRDSADGGLGVDAGFDGGGLNLDGGGGSG